MTWPQLGSRATIDARASCRRKVRFDQADPSSEQVMHHTLLELSGFGELGFQRSDLSVHIAQDEGDGDLFLLCRRSLKDEVNEVLLIKMVDCRTSTKLAKEVQKNIRAKHVI